MLLSQQSSGGAEVHILHLSQQGPGKAAVLLAYDTAVALGIARERYGGVFMLLHLVCKRSIRSFCFYTGFVQA